MVLTQPIGIVREVMKQKFPYHYGSYATADESDEDS